MMKRRRAKKKMLHRTRREIENFTQKLPHIHSELGVKMFTYITKQPHSDTC